MLLTLFQTLNRYLSRSVEHSLILFKSRKSRHFELSLCYQYFQMFVQRHFAETRGDLLFCHLIVDYYFVI